ncbi:MAG: GGDEF domain-containing protein [Rhodospirillaceae bacterium]
MRSLEVRLVDIDGERRTVQLSMSRLFWEGLPVINIVFTDITVLKIKEHELFILSTTDSLTGAYNRRYFMDTVEREFRLYQRHHVPLSLMVLDIDFFKHVNDAFGHAVGDRAIKALVDACNAGLRREDVLGRMGGEEFAVMLPLTGLEGAMAMAERLRLRIESIVLQSDTGEPVRFTVSIGVSRALASDLDIDAALVRADRALYEAKAAGRNRVAVAS